MFWSRTRSPLRGQPRPAYIHIHKALDMCVQILIEIIKRHDAVHCGPSFCIYTSVHKYTHVYTKHQTCACKY